MASGKKRGVKARFPELVRVGLMMSPEMYEWIQIHAMETRVSSSEVIRIAISEYQLIITRVEGKERESK